MPPHPGLKAQHTAHSTQARHHRQIDRDTLGVSAAANAPPAASATSSRGPGAAGARWREMLERRDFSMVCQKAEVARPTVAAFGSAERNAAARSRICTASSCRCRSLSAYSAAPAAAATATAAARMIHSPHNDEICTKAPLPREVSLGTAVHQVICMHLMHATRVLSPITASGVGAAGRMTASPRLWH